jgi:hypothetical protein
MTHNFESAIRRSAALLTTALLLGLATAQDEGEPGLGDDDPTIFPEEVVDPEAGWEDGWGGSPPPWFEDPASVDCGGREACRESLENQTGGAA